MTDETSDGVAFTTISHPKNSILGASLMLEQLQSLSDDRTKIGYIISEFNTALTAERERLVDAIKMKSDSKEHQTNEQYLAYEEAVDDILNLINPPSNQLYDKTGNTM